MLQVRLIEHYRTHIAVFVTETEIYKFKILVSSVMIENMIANLVLMKMNMKIILNLVET